MGTGRAQAGERESVTFVYYERATICGFLFIMNRFSKRNDIYLNYVCFAVAEPLAIKKRRFVKAPSKAMKKCLLQHLVKVIAT